MRARDRRWLPLVVGAVVLAAIASPARADDAASCPPPTPPLTIDRVQEGLRTASDHGFLWRITKDGRTSYLYGTIHVARLEWMFPGALVSEAMKASDTVALELDVLDPDIQKRLVAAIGPARADPLPADLAARLAKRREAECVDAAAYETYAPEFQVASLSVLAARRDGLDAAYAIDLVIDGLAHALGKPVVSLETPESQMQALKMPTPEQTNAFVDAGLAELESGRSRPLIEHLVKDWVESDYDDLARYGEWCGCLNSDAEREQTRRLLDERNPAMAASIDRLHGGGQSVFAAVGSLHMIGPAGLPVLMRRLGYKVEQADFAR